MSATKGVRESSSSNVNTRLVGLAGWPGGPASARRPSPDAKIISGNSGLAAATSWKS